MIYVKIVRNDLPKMMKANDKIALHLDNLLSNIGELLLDSAQEAMDSGGPNWKKHSSATIKRWGVHSLLHTPTSKSYKTKEGTPLSDIRANYHYLVGNTFRGKAELDIVGITSHGRKMYGIHNRPRGKLLRVGGGAKIPGRPYFRWRTGHTQASEESKARKITIGYIKRELRSYGIKTSGFLFEHGA